MKILKDMKKKRSFLSSVTSCTSWWKKLTAANSGKPDGVVNVGLGAVFYKPRKRHIAADSSGKPNVVGNGCVVGVGGVSVKN